MNAHVERHSPRLAPPLTQFGRKGQLTQARQVRTLLMYAALCLVGIAPIWLEVSPGWQAAGIAGEN